MGTSKIEKLNFDVFDEGADKAYTIQQTINALIEVREADVQRMDRIEEAMTYLADFCGEEENIEPSNTIWKILTNK
jgi:hypothetical protein